MDSPMKSPLTYPLKAAGTPNLRVVPYLDISRCWLVRNQSLGSTATRQSGVGLIEVMVAVLVLSIAFLGIAALQAVSLSTSNDSMARSMATIVSYSILDGLRADSANAKATLYNTAAASPSTATCPAASGSLVNYQNNQWCTQLAANLGASALTTWAILCDASGTCTVTITFTDNRVGQGAIAQAQTIVTRAVL